MSLPFPKQRSSLRPEQYPLCHSRPDLCTRAEHPLERERVGSHLDESGFVEWEIVGEELYSRGPQVPTLPTPQPVPPLRHHLAPRFMDTASRASDTGDTPSLRSTSEGARIALPARPETQPEPSRTRRLGLGLMLSYHFPFIGHHRLCLPFARSPGPQVQPEDKALVGGLSTRVGRLSSGVGILWTSVGTVPTTATPSSRTQGVSKTSTMFERVRRSRFARSFRSLYASSLTLICGIWHLLADKCNGLSAVCQQGEA